MEAGQGVGEEELWGAWGGATHQHPITANIPLRWVVLLCRFLEPLGSYLVDATYTVSKSYGSILKQRGLRCIDIAWGGTINRKIFNPKVSTGASVLGTLYGRLATGFSRLERCERRVVALAGRAFERP